MGAAGHTASPVKRQISPFYAIQKPDSENSAGLIEGKSSHCN